MKVNICKKGNFNHAEQGDLVILENGVNMLICRFNETTYYTLDVKTGDFCTTGIHISSMEDYKIGNKVYDYSAEIYKIIDIIKADELVLSI